MTTKDDETRISDLIMQQTQDDEPSNQPIVIGPHTMDRIASMITNDPNLGTVIMGVIEAGGGDGSKKWRLHLRGVLTAVTE